MESVRFSHACFAPCRKRSVLPAFLKGEEERMADAARVGRTPRGFSLKAFGDWRAKFKAERQPRKLVYRPLS
jgi:hypothetical protein